MAKVTFLTGASSGLGRALAPLLAADGDRMALVARRAEALETLAEQIRERGGVALPLSCDVTNRDEVHAAVRRCEGELGPIDLMIANAGISVRSPAKAFSAETFETVVGVNLFGAAYGFEAVLPGMIERRSGQLVGISSLAGYRGLPGSGPYCASKAALISLLESLRLELRAYDIAVTTICPGFVETPLTEHNRFKMPFLLEVDAAVRHMHRAIRRRKTEYAFPWQLASLAKIGRFLPNALYDRLFSGRNRK